MQTYITETEHKNIASLTKGRGRVGWFLGKAGISYTPLKSLRNNRKADSECVQKVREFLDTPEAQALIALAEEAEEKAAA